MYVFIHEGVNSLNSVPYRCLHMYRSAPLVQLDSCLTAAACLSSACSFAVSQVSDLGLLVGYVA